MPLAPEALRQAAPEASRRAQQQLVRLLVSHPAPPTPLRPDAITLADWHFDDHAKSKLAAGSLQALNETKTAWAHFLNDVHNRLHPVFTGEYLASLDYLSDGDRLNNPELAVVIWLEATQLNGEISALYVQQSSGVPEFDVAALAAFMRVFPMPIPAEIASYDGRIYFEWTLRRNREACSTFNAIPRRLKAPVPSLH